MDDKIRLTSSAAEAAPSPEGKAGRRDDLIRRCGGTFPRGEGRGTIQMKTGSLLQKQAADFCQ